MYNSMCWLFSSFFYQLRSRHVALPVSASPVSFLNMPADAPPCDKTWVKSLNKTHILTYITDTIRQSHSMPPFVSPLSLTETRGNMMSALQRLPQQCEICLSSPVMVESVSIYAIVYCTVAFYITACIIHRSKGHMCMSCISLHPQLKQIHAVRQVEKRARCLSLLLSLNTFHHL